MHVRKKKNRTKQKKMLNDMKGDLRKPMYNQLITHILNIYQTLKDSDGVTTPTLSFMGQLMFILIYRN